TSLDNFRGSIVALATSYCVDNPEAGEFEYNFGDILLTSYRDFEGRRITLTSDIVDAEVSGQFKTAELPNGLLSSLYSVLPSLVINESEIWEVKDQYFEYAIEIKDFSLVNQLILPGIDFGNMTTVRGSYDARKMFFDLQLNTDYFRTGQFVFDTLRLEAEKNSDVMALWVHSNRLPLSDSLQFHALDLR